MQKSDVLKIAEKMEREIDFDNLFKGEKGHADLFVAYHQDTIKLISNQDGYYFNESLNLWEEKTKRDFGRLVSDFLDDHICHTIKELVSDKKKADKYYELNQILKKVRTVKHCDDVFKFAAPLLIDKDFKSKLNKIPNLLPISKGRVIDLKTLEIRLRRKTDYFDFELPYDFIPTKIGKATKFFEQIMRNDKGIVNYLQTLLGYCITGETNLRSMFIFWGAGSNGKSTLCDLLSKILNKF